jgi:hypothetical protein
MNWRTHDDIPSAEQGAGAGAVSLAQLVIAVNTMLFEQGAEAGAGAVSLTQFFITENTISLLCDHGNNACKR